MTGQTCPTCRSRRIQEDAPGSFYCLACSYSWPRKPARSYYAVSYPQGYAAPNDAQNPILVYRFDTLADRDQWVQAGPPLWEPAGRSSATASDPCVQVARRAAAANAAITWPISVVME